jgi:hypothetical protein
MTYHSESNFEEEYFQAAYRGQEFIVENVDPYIEWFKDLLKLRYGRWD